MLDSYFKDPVYEGVEVKLGGSTSFDIFPKGWDKTYVMNHLDNYSHIYFVGDKSFDYAEKIEKLIKQNKST